MPRILLLLLLLFILQSKSLIYLSIHINCTLLLYFRISELSLTRALTTLLYFGIALVVLTGVFTWLLTKRPNNSISILSSLVNCYRTLARKKNTIQFWQMSFQALDYKGNNFLVKLIMITSILNLLTQRAILGSNYFGYSNTLCV